MRPDSEPEMNRSSILFLCRFGTVALALFIAVAPGVSTAEEQPDAAAPAAAEVQSAAPASPLADWLRNWLPESLKRHAFLLENWQWLGLLIVVMIGVIIERLLTVFVGLWIRRLTRRNENEKEKAGQEALDLARRRQVHRGFTRPLGLMAMAFVWLALLPVLNLPQAAAAPLLFASRLIAAAGGLWAAYRLVDLIGAYMVQVAARTETRFDDILVPMVRRSLKIVVLAVGVIFILDNLDVDIWGLLAGLGIGGIAVALAAKDTVENLFGSVTVLTDRPFQIGDWVKIGDVEGTVEEIGFRSTRIRTFYNSLITVPNAKMTTAVIDNMGRRRYRRVKCSLGIEYDTPPETIDAFCEGIRELIRVHPYTRKDYYMVYLHEFAESSLNILLYAFHEVPDWGTELRERHRLFADIIRLANRLGVSFAFPTQTLHLASLPGGALAPGLPEALSGSAEKLPQPDADAAREQRKPTDAPATVDDAVSLGRKLARDVAKENWGESRQAPVSFDDPDLIRTGE